MGRPAFDPATGLLYVNANEMPWTHSLVPRSDKSLYRSQCASCHGDDLKGLRDAPSLVGISTRRTREQLLQVIGQGTGRMPGFAAALDSNAVKALADFLVTGRDVADTLTNNPNLLKYRSTGLKIWLDPDGYPPITPPWGTLNAIDLNRGAIKWKIPFGEYPKLVAQGVRNTGAIITAARSSRRTGCCSSRPPPTTTRSALLTRPQASCCGKRRFRLLGMRRRHSTW
jgi:quinoprotein glucose dehydrogenase